MVDITTWTENKAIGWHSNEGFKQIGMWAFTPKGDKTQVTFDMEYEFGGGIAGKLLGRAAEPIVRGNLQRSVETLKLHTEKLGASKSALKAGAQRATGSAKATATATTKPATKTRLQRARRAAQNLQQSQQHGQRTGAKKSSRKRLE